MAIKIQTKGQLPQFGRITMPRGTYLSNPATAADGVGQGGSGTNPPAPTTPSIGAMPWQQQLWNPQNLGQFGKGIAGWWNSLPGSQATPTLYNDNGQPVLGGTTTNTFGNQTEVVQNKVVKDSAGNTYTWNGSSFVHDSTHALDVTKPNSPSNSLVGRDLGSSPNVISVQRIKQMFPNSTGEEISQVMISRGYMSVYQAGVGQVWVMAQQTANSASGNPSGIYGGTDQRGRPFAVNGAELQRGERVTNANGIAFVGGDPYTDKGGNTVGQYSITIPNQGARNDKHGKYKWESTVRKDENGNWVRVNRQVLRKVYSRSHLKKAADQRQAQQNNDVNPGEMQQLVNFRANYG